MYCTVHHEKGYAVEPVQRAPVLGATILAHDVRQLFEAAGYVWTEETSRDIGIAVQCLLQNGTVGSGTWVQPFDDAHTSAPRRTATAYATVNYQDNGGDR
jgi:hypothetical protein